MNGKGGWGGGVCVCVCVWGGGVNQREKEIGNERRGGEGINKRYRIRNAVT